MHDQRLFASASVMNRLALSLLLSLLLIMYGPVAFHAGAQSVAAQTADIKSSAARELDRRIDNFETTLKNLSEEPRLQNEKLSVEVAGRDVTLRLPADVKAKVQQLTQKYSDKIKVMKSRVATGASATELRAYAKSINGQFALDKLANAQGAVTTTIEDTTKVFDELTSTYDALQTQISKLRTCATSTTTDCKGLSNVDQGLAESLQTQLDNAASVMRTIGSLIASSLALIATIVPSMEKLTSNLGDLSKLTDEATESQTSSINGLMASLRAITSQGDIVSSMSASASEMLASVAGTTSSLNF